MAEQPQEPEAQKESTLATVAFERTGIQLHTFDDVWRFANIAVKSNFAPKGMSIEDAVCAIQLGSEVGLSAMSALQRIAVINGRPSVWGDALLGICQRNKRFDHGAFRETLEGTPYEDTYTAVCFVKRVGSEAGVESHYSVADAKKANLWGKQGTWTTNPKRMLKYRARAFALRDAFADVVTGLYDRDEMLDADMPEVRVVSARDVTDAEIADRLRRKPAPAPPPAPANETMTKGAPPPKTQSEAAMAVQALLPPEPLPAAESPAQADSGPPAGFEGAIGRESELYKKVRTAYDKLKPKQREEIRRELSFKLVTDIGLRNNMDANDALIAIEAKLAEATT